MNIYFPRCYHLNSLSPSISTLSRIPPKNTASSLHLPIISISRKREFSCLAATDTESESNDEKDKVEPVNNESSIEDSLKRIDNMLKASEKDEKIDKAVSVESSKITDALKKINSILGASESSIQDPVKPTTAESSDAKNPVDGTDSSAKTGESMQEKDADVEVSSGSPLPGMKQIGEPMMIPKETIDKLKAQVFGFDTFYVTSHEPYEQGVLFKGNLRGKAATSYEKITKRLQDIFADQFRLFLLVNPEDDEPVAVIVPKQTLPPEQTAVPEWFAASAFGLVTIFTLLLRNVPALQSNLLSILDNLELLKDGIPGALVTASVLGIHEIGHILVAKDIDAKLGVPFFVPSWQIGSFGAITRILNVISNREDLLKLAAAGPLAGFGLGFVFLLLGFILPPSDGIGIIVDPGVFHESFLVGGVAKLLLGDALREGTKISINPLVLWGWAGLLINAVNSIPAGELDGGRISFALWGRKISSRLSSAAIALLGISSLFNDIAFYWVVLIFFLQRGPISPLSEEISEPDGKYVTLGIAVLFLGLLICLPYPFPFINEGPSIDF